MDKNQRTEQENRKEEYKAITLMQALHISVEFGFMIVLPLLLFVFLGKFLDNRYNQNFFVLIGIVLALMFSSVWFYISIDRIIKRLKK